MDITATQRRNNRIFIGLMLVLLALIASVGQVSKIYRLIINLVTWSLR